jgi:hypothetical protein
MFYLPLRVFRQVNDVDVDVALAYISDGNSKPGAVIIGNLNTAGGGGARQRSSPRYTLWVNGAVAWKYVLTSPGPEYSRVAKTVPIDATSSPQYISRKRTKPEITST